MPDTDALIAALGNERNVHFWGGDYKISPGIVSEILGDGRQLLRMTPMNTRPMFYFIRIDSGVTFCEHEGECSPANCVYEILDDIMDAIEDEFGEWPDETEDERGECTMFDCGCYWGHEDWPGTQSHIWQD